MSEVLTREAILQAEDLRREKVDVPEWGGAVYVRTLTLAELARLMDGCEQPDEAPIARSFRIERELVALAACDEAGEPLFGPGDVDALARKSRAPIKRVFDVADRLNQITADAREAAEKN